MIGLDLPGAVVSIASARRVRELQDQREDVLQAITDALQRDEDPATVDRLFLDLDYLDAAIEHVMLVLTPQGRPS